MASRNQIGEFLTSRRGRLTPAQAGLRAIGRRRVSGLRREEVALLAGMSVEYYTPLERGNVRGAIEAVLDTVARALQLDLTRLVGELSLRRDDFRGRWAAHDVHLYSSGTQRFRHPLGDLALRYEALQPVSDPGLTIVAYTAEPGSDSHAGLRDLARRSRPEPDDPHVTASDEPIHIGLPETR